MEELKKNNHLSAYILLYFTIKVVAVIVQNMAPIQ